MSEFTILLVYGSETVSGPGTAIFIGTTRQTVSVFATDRVQAFLKVESYLRQRGLSVSVRSSGHHDTGHYNNPLGFNSSEQAQIRSVCVELVEHFPAGVGVQVESISMGDSSRNPQNCIDPSIVRNLIQTMTSYTPQGEVIGPNPVLSPIQDSSDVSATVISDHLNYMMINGWSRYSAAVGSNRPVQFASMEPTFKALKWAERFFSEEDWRGIEDEFSQSLWQ